MQKQKYNTRLVSKIKADREFDKNQLRLKHQYGISQDKRVVVVEKNNTFKFAVKAFVNAIHVIATALLLFLAMVGLLSLLYPDTRAVLWDIAREIIMEAKQYMGVS